MRKRSPVGSALAIAGLFGALLLLGTSDSIHAQDRTLRGRVVDAQTNELVAHAVVLVVWLFAEGAPGLVYSELVDVRESETDADGQFAVEDLSRPTTDMRVTVYKPGYVGWSNIYTYPPLRRRVRPQPFARIELASRAAVPDIVDDCLFLDLARAAGLYGADRNPQFQAAVGPACGHSGLVRQ